MSLRIEKINSLVQQYIGEMLTKELSLKPDVFVSVSKVDTTNDMRYTRIFLSVFPTIEKEYVDATLKKEVHRLQKGLNDRMQVKIIPRIQFMIEDRQERVSEIDKVFEQIEKEKDSGQD